ncbi:Hypothetical predicted protein [Mytilus galloprovincialis]|uniref:Uncharacterized protein n=1 Tax=Mytilus galloprovincialis TaxID=29158 RepID=A0A8B6CPJ8_MYTGA|nr:Hypothetical predicted protein [Mytilus galloprovincialis]
MAIHDTSNLSLKNSTDICGLLCPFMTQYSCIFRSKLNQGIIVSRLDLHIPFGKTFPLTASEDYQAYHIRQLKKEFDGSIIPRLGKTIADKWISDTKFGHTVPIFDEIPNIVDISRNRKMICVPDVLN